VTRRDPDTASRVCHGVEQIERLGATDTIDITARIERRQVLGGLISEYHSAA
jgi:hypothetical protein